MTEPTVYRLTEDERTVLIEIFQYGASLFRDACDRGDYGPLPEHRAETPRPYWYELDYIKLFNRLAHSDHVILIEPDGLEDQLLNGTEDD